MHLEKLNVNKTNALVTIEEPMEVDDVPAPLPRLTLAPSKNNGFFT
jgi:hypothetical protein